MPHHNYSFILTKWGPNFAIVAGHLRVEGSDGGMPILGEGIDKGCVAL